MKQTYSAVVALSIMFTFFCFTSGAQTNDNCSNPRVLSNLTNYCSAGYSFSNSGATDDGYGLPACWAGGTVHDVWFSFVAKAFDVNITVNGASTGLGTLNYPQVALYSGACGGTINELGCKAGSSTANLYKGGLTIGETYLIRVDGGYSYTGSFNICINNFSPQALAGGDCGTSAPLCNKNPFTIPNVTGPGSDPYEGFGSCLDLGFGNVESNSTWFTWTAQTSGSLTFDISPLTPSDDIDFVLYQLGAGGCSNKTQIRCNASSCMGPNNLGMTGLGSAGTKTVEQPGCGGSGGNGNNSYSTAANITAGVTYALFVNNWTSANNGFTIAFGGTSTFRGPVANFNYSYPSSPCGLAAGTPVTFTDSSTGASGYNWTFGPNATPSSYSGINPPPVSFNTPGTYTVALEVTSPAYPPASQGCKVVATKTIVVAAPTPLPVTNPVTYCQNAAATPLTATGAGLLWYSASTGGTGSATAPTPSTSTAGSTTYYVSQTVGGCESQRAALTVNVNAMPVAAAGPNASICIGANTLLTAGGGTSYSWSPSTGLSNTAIFNPTADPSATTTYTVIVSDANGCSSAATTTVTVTPLPTIIISPSTSICPNSTTQLSASGGTSYLWSPASAVSNSAISNPIATPSATTTYMVVVTDANGCINSATTTVTVSSSLTVITSPSASVCTGLGTQISASGGTIYAWSPAAGLSNPNISNPVATPGATTTYSVAVTDANGCSGNGTVDVTVNPLPIVTVSPAAAVCVGGNTQLSAGGGTQYAWSPAASLDNSGIYNPIATPPSATNYTVTVTDANGCVNTGSTLISINTPPVISISPNVGICPGMNMQITASGGSTYLWAPNTGLNDPNIFNPTASPAATTTYSLLVTDANGCTNTAATTVTVNPLMTPLASPDTAICIGSQAQLNVTGANAATYSWAPALNLSNTAIANPVATPAATTTYSVTVTSSFGCAGSTTIRVAVNSLPVVTVSPPSSVCVGGNTQLSAGGGTQYAWSPAANLDNSGIYNPVATPSAATTYSVVVTDANGCINTGSTTITINPPPVISLSPASAICTGMSLQLTSSGGTNYAWSPAGSLDDPTIPNPTATPPATTTYSLTVTDANGCTNTASTTITVNNYISLNISADTAICSGGQVQLNVSGPSATTYAWTPALSLDNVSIATPVATPIATTSYSVTVNNSFGCSGSATVTVSVNPLPVVTVSPDTSVCLGASMQLSAGGGVQYSWSPSTGLSNSNVFNPVATPVAVTTYSVTVTDANGCVNRSATKLSLDSIVVNVSSNAAVCMGASTQISAGGGVTYLWSPSMGLSNPYIDNPVATPAATTNYTVQVTNAKGCKGSGAVTIGVNSLPIVNVVSSPSTICPGGSTQLSASGGVQYVWSPDPSLSSTSVFNPVASPSVTTAYTVTATDINGCMNRGSTTVLIGTPPIASAGPDTSLCAGESIQLNPSVPTSGLTFLWQPSPSLSNLNVPDPVVNPRATTAYIVSVSNASGCPPLIDTVIVAVHPAPPVNAGRDTSIMAGSSVILLAAGAGLSYQWTPSENLSCSNCNTVVASPLQTTTYVVETTDYYGCRNSDTVLVEVDDILTLYVPSAFTPGNKDLDNNFFNAYGIGILQFEFYVFDRWGTLLFESNDPQLGWDGSYKGMEVQQDVYVYLAKAKSITGKSVTKTGSVTVVK